MHRPILYALLAWGVLCGTARAVELQLSPTEDTASPTQRIESGDPEILPDGEVVAGNGRLAACWLAVPTDRYGHAVLGDGVEALEVRVRLNDGSRLRFAAGPSRVFEDRFCRLGDLDGDGADDILVVRSDADAGAAPVVLSLRGDRLVEIAAAQPLGTAYRWLNPVGIADFDGDGENEVAAVVTPHLAGALTLYERDGATLVPSIVRPGYSNHVIGARHMRQAAVVDGNGDGVPDILLPSLDRHRLHLIAVVDDGFAELASVALPQKIASDLWPLGEGAFLFEGRSGGRFRVTVTD